MKKLLTLSVVLAATIALADSTTVILNQDFEGCAEGAALGQAGMVASPSTQWGAVSPDGATIETVDGNKVLKVTQVEGSGQCGIAIPIDDSCVTYEPGNYLFVTFKRFQNEGHRYGEFRLSANYDASTTSGAYGNRPVLNFENNGTQLNFLNQGYDLSDGSQEGKTTEYPGAVTEGEWQEFQFTFDLATGLIDFFIDGARQSSSTYQLSMKRCDGFKYVIFANGTGGADTTRPGVYIDDLKVEFVEATKKLVRSFSFDGFENGQTLSEICPEWMSNLGDECYITNLSFNADMVSCLWLPHTANTGFLVDIDADNYQGETYAVEFGFASHYFRGQRRFDIRSNGMTFWRFWNNWHWKTSFKVDGVGTEKQYGNDGPIDVWVKNTFVFNQDGTLLRTGRIDTGNKGVCFRAIGGYDFQNSPDHTFGYTDDISGSVDSVAYYHGWWGSEEEVFVDGIKVYVYGVPEPGFLALGLIALVAFLRRR
jgi:hypothetical protein